MESGSRSLLPAEDETGRQLYAASYILSGLSRIRAVISPEASCALWPSVSIHLQVTVYICIRSSLSRSVSFDSQALCPSNDSHAHKGDA